MRATERRARRGVRAPDGSHSYVAKFLTLVLPNTKDTLLKE